MNIFQVIIVSTNGSLDYLDALIKVVRRVDLDREQPSNVILLIFISTVIWI